MQKSTVSVLPHHVVNVGVFLSWTITSFFCHKCAAIYIRLSRDTLHGVILLTATQICTCFCCLKLRSKRGTHDSVIERFRTSVACGHMIATLSTNYSLSLIPASSTFAIKMLEPITSAVVVSMTQSRRPRLSTVMSLCVITLGAFIFTGNPLRDGVLLKGILVALLSNVSLAVRNTSLKTAFKNNHGVATHTSMQILVVITMTPYVAYVLCALHGEEDVLQRTLFISISSLAHVLYSFMSVALVLKSVSVVTHAVLNIFKRVVVVLLLCVFGQRSLTSFNIFGLFIAAVGLELYSASGRTKTKDVNPAGPSTNRSCRHQVAFYFLAGIACFAMIQIHISNSQLLPTLEKEAQLRPPTGHLEDQAKPFQKETDGKLFILNELHNMSHTYKVQRNVIKSGRQRKTDEREKVQHQNSNKMVLPHQVSSERNIPSNRFMLRKKTFQGVIGESQRVLVDVLKQLTDRYRYIALVDIAVHENKGDAAISAGELLLLKRLGKEIIFYCNTYACTEKNLAAGRSKALQYGLQNVAVLCHGGGNLVGYEEHDTLRAKVFEIFHDFERIVLPQSIWLKPGSHLTETEGVYRRHPNVTILLRDAVSMKLARKHFPLNKRFLVPDSAFLIGQVSRNLRPSYDIVWLKRGDVEKAHYKLPTFPPNVSIAVGDWQKWMTAKGPTTIENVFLIAHNGFTFLQRGRVAITDRLHGHIMCILLHMPHVLLDTADHKIQSYHRTWTQGLEGETVLTAVSAEDAINKARQLLEKFRGSLSSIDPLMSLKESII